jgi:hypothetical protein
MEDRPQRNVYWALPNLLVLALGVALILLGHVVLGSVVLALAVLGLLVLAQEAARRDLVASGYGRMRALSGYAGASMRTWSRTSGRVARLRLDSARLIRERRRTQYELGAAAYARDAEACEQLIERMQMLDEELADCAAEMERAVNEAQVRLAQERLAIRPTEIRRPG